MEEQVSRKYSKSVARKKQDGLKNRFSNLLSRFSTATRVHNSVRSRMGTNVKEANKILKAAAKAKRRLSTEEKKTLKQFALTEDDKAEIENSFRTFQSMHSDFKNLMKDTQELIDYNPSAGTIDLNFMMGVHQLGEAIEKNAHPLNLLYHSIHPLDVEFNHKDQEHILAVLQEPVSAPKLPKSKFGTIRQKELDDIELKVVMKNPHLKKDLEVVKKRIADARGK
jgi:hypothetical protein